jgi:hypothetical protein
LSKASDVKLTADKIDRGGRNTMSKKAIGRLATAFPPPSYSAQVILAAALLSGVLMTLAGCRADAPTPSDGAPRSGGPPIAPAILRSDVERQEAWTPLRKAACPRQLPDRHEELRRYPAIRILEGLGYIKITDGTAFGIYVKNMEITDVGRRELGSDLEEEAERYVITIARREYLPGTERFEILPGPERLVAHFKWWWNPLNALGERLTLGPPSSPRGEYGGFATYTRAADGWALNKLFLNSEDRDYMRSV